MLNRRVLVITGAGISAESGIPTFRGKDGYWRNLDPAKIATPEAFERNPQLVWEWYRERRAAIRAAQPNRAHIAVTKLEKHCSEFLLATQNVDDLHLRAQYEGETMSSDKVVQIHGDIFLTRCSCCGYRCRELHADRADLPLCHSCGRTMRPGVVWFGETLDPQTVATIEDFLSNGACDVVLAIGTTAVFGYIVEWAVRAAAEKGRLIEVNPKVTPLTRFASESFRESAGSVLPKLVDDLIRA